jgi:hypothetical protein
MRLYPRLSHPFPTNKVVELIKTFAMIAASFAMVGVARAATVSFGTNPPVLGSVIISNLTGAVAPGGSPNNPPNSNVDDPKYVAFDQPAQGQTFTTGPNAGGYKLMAVTLKQVSYDTFSLVPCMNYTIRITRPVTTNTLSVIATETAEVALDWTGCDTCNFPTIGDGSGKGAGSGRYITFRLDTPVPLAANTVYGFDVGGGSVKHYWETDGRDSTPGGGGGGTPLDPYLGGNAYNSGPSAGRGDNTITNRAGDRVFVVALNPANVITPPRITRQPKSPVFYAGRTAQLLARAAGDTNLVYQWRKDGTNLVNGPKFSGALTDTLSISNVSAGDAGSYALVVTNSGGAVTSTPPATLAVVAAPVASSSYGYAVSTNKALVYWRLNEAVDPSTNPPAYDYIGGGIGTYGSASIRTNGPRPSVFPGFESTNTAAQSTTFLDQSWVTVPSLDLNTNTVTFTAWIYPSGAQQEFAGLFVTQSGATRAGISYGDHYTTPSSVGQLTYTWNQGWIRAYSSSSMTIPSDQWSFVGLVVTPTSGTLYLGTNGPLLAAVNSTPHTNELWTGTGTVLIGFDPEYGPERIFNGIIDEVAVFKRSLSLDEVNTLYNIGRGIVQPVPPSFAGEPPTSQALYAGRTARFSTLATGSAPLVYRWRKNGINLSDGGNISGAQTDSLTISNVAAGDVGAYTLVVTNAVGAITSGPAATLTIVTPSGKGYEAAVRSAGPFAYWRLNESGDPSTNTAAFDYWGGFAGTYGSAALNGFNSVAGPQPPDFSQFELGNSALEAPFATRDSWVTVPALNLNSNNLTFTLWFLPTIDPINNLAGLFFTHEGSESGNGCGLRYSTGNQLGYTWNNGGIQFDSGLIPPTGLWSFAALVIEPTKGTLYLFNSNGPASATNTIPHTAEAWDGRALIGYDGGYYDINFPGRIDEVAVFNYAFTPAQVLSLYNAAFTTSAPPVTLTIQKVGANVVLSWPQGTLLEGNSVTGPWTTNSAISPYTNAPNAASKFFRVKVQ